MTEVLFPVILGGEKIKWLWVIMSYKRFFCPNSIKILVGFLFLNLVVGCAPIVDIRGNFPDREVVSLLEIGVHTKDQVSELLGPPSSYSPFNKNSWIYMGQKTETVSFLSPEVLEQFILVINFDKNDLLQSVEEIDSKKQTSFPLVTRETPTSGHDMTFLQELFGSFGRFNRPLKDDKGKD